MGNKTKIQWTDRTWNPVSGCLKVSPGCKNCYAETVAHRFWKGRKFTDVRLHPERLEEPLHWRKPSRVFVNSMSDLFHEDVPDEFLGDVFRTMTCPAVPRLHCGAEHHTFQILTKRPERMREFCNAMANSGWIPPNNCTGVTWPAENVWLGVSVENRGNLFRLDILRQTPAAVRFVSFEPLLEDVGGIDLTGIDWVIVGGESGPDARPCNLEWIRDIVRQCQAAGVPVFVKQLGAKPRFGKPKGQCAQSYAECERPLILSDRHGGDPAGWPEDLRVREFPLLSLC